MAPFKNKNRWKQRETFWAQISIVSSTSLVGVCNVG